MGFFWLRKYAVHLASSVILFLAVFEIKIILGDFYENGFSYYPHLSAVCFITFNLIGNLICCYLNESNVVKSPAWKPFENMNEPTNWRYCEKCQILAPPRSWHCSICQICILKRDHHCLITGRCIGHNNYRYFLVFLTYAVIGACYAIYLDVVYVFWCNSDFFDNFLTKICFINPPLLLLKYFWDGEIAELNLSYGLLPIFMAILSSGAIAHILLYEHGKRFLKGATYHEAYTTRYNLGCWTRNLEMALGKHFILVWIAPCFSSELPHDGVNWDPQIVEPKRA